MVGIQNSSMCCQVIACKFKQGVKKSKTPEDLGESELCTRFAAKRKATEATESADDATRRDEINSACKRFIL